MSVLDGYKTYLGVAGLVIHAGDLVTALHQITSVGG